MLWNLDSLIINTSRRPQPPPKVHKLKSIRGYIHIRPCYSGFTPVWMEIVWVGIVDTSRCRYKLATSKEPLSASELPPKFLLMSPTHISPWPTKIGISSSWYQILVIRYHYCLCLVELLNIDLIYVNNIVCVAKTLQQPFKKFLAGWFHLGYIWAYILVAKKQWPLSSSSNYFQFKPKLFHHHHHPDSKILCWLPLSYVSSS